MHLKLYLNKYEIFIDLYPNKDILKIALLTFETPYILYPIYKFKIISTRK